MFVPSIHLERRGPRHALSNQWLETDDFEMTIPIQETTTITMIVPIAFHAISTSVWPQITRLTTTRQATRQKARKR